MRTWRRTHRVTWLVALAALVALGIAAPAFAGMPGPAPGSAPAATAFKLGPQTTPEQLLALPSDAQVETETGKKMTAAEAKKAMKARKKHMAKLKKKPPVKKKGPKVASPKPAPAPTTLRAATTVMATPAPAVAAGAPTGSPSLSAAPVATASAIMARPAVASPGIGNANEGYLACGMSAQIQRYLSSVNGASSGAVFTPDGVYKITGCGFGAKKGTVKLSGGSTGGNLNVSLLIESWANDVISARVDPKLSGVADQSNVDLVVTPSGGTPMEQGGHSFVAATEEVVLKSVPAGWLESSKARPPATVKSPADSGATLEVTNNYDPNTQFCPHDASTDVLRLSRLELKNGYGVERAEVSNRLQQGLTQPDDPNPAYINTQSSGWNGDDFQVSPQSLELYWPRDIFVGGNSFCLTNYEITVVLRGPRGLPAQ